MSSLTNVNVQAKTMNGLNIINANEISTDTFTTNNLDTTTLTVSGTINLPAASILDSYLSNNVAILNKLTTQTFQGNMRFDGNTFFYKNAEFRTAISGDNLFQAYKNTSGNAGHILANGAGELLYYDSSAALTKWKLDTDGKLTVGNIDISGTLISKTATGDFIRSNSNASQYFFATNGGQIGYADSTSNIGVGWNINSNGTARFKSSTNSFKYWEFAGNLLRYYNLGGAYSISMNGDTGLITSVGVPVNGSDLINKTYGDATYPGIGSVVNLTGTQTISGAKTFSNTLTTTGGINASAAQTITFGTNNPTMGELNINYGTAALRVGTGRAYSQNSIAIGNTSFGTAIQSVAIGDSALNASGATASYSVAIGVNSLKLATGERNTAIGTDSLPLLTGTGNGANTAIGNLTGTKLTSGVQNLFLGLGSGAGLTSGSNNLIVGSSMFASVSPDTGTGISNNVCVGSNAMGYIKNNAINNCAIGAYALYSEAGYGGASTVAIGPNAGVRALGSNCVFLGENATVSPANSVFDNSVAIGYNSTITSSNQIKIGTSSQNTIIPGSLKVDGTIGSGTTTTFGDISATSLTTTGDISTTLGTVYGVNMQSDNLIAGKFLDLQDALSYIMFSAVNAGIRIGVSSTFLTDTTANNINIGNSSTALGGENVVMGYNAKGGSTGLGGALKGQGTVLLGAYADSEGEYSVGVGHNTTSYKEGVAIGRNAVSQTQGVSIGYGSNAGQATNIAIGYNATTPFMSSHAIGTGIATTAQGQFALGSTANSFLFSQTFFPWEVSPTTITAAGTTLPGAPFYGWYLIATTAPGGHSITIPVITAQMVGLVLNFRKTNANAIGSTTTITCSAGNTYMPLNSITATAAGVLTGFIGGTSTTGRICIINTTQFAVLN